ncbi:MAG: tRNA pseudouridine(38-40) synthase TruA [Bacteroidota bacterium]|nr:tRNA pseudouridine(38-40) synthase TruA [Bacteroidota bacterium]
MGRYFIKLAYSGSDYHGWQIQPNAITIQEEINNSLSLILRETINVVGAGRTDTGVHASDFYAHFDIEKDLGGEKELDRLVFRLNRFLPKAIAVYSIFKVGDGFHARFDAISRTYKYYVAERKNPFIQETSYQLLKSIDIDRMNSAAKILFEYDDFTSFSKSHTQTNTNLCTIMHAEWNREGDGLVFTIKANRFLRNMVRAIVGTLLEIGLGKLDVDDMRRIILSKNRSEAGYSVPAKGLFLTDIEYDF